MIAGLAIYSGNMDRLVEFYRDVLGLEVVENDGCYARLTNNAFELTILEREMSKSLASLSEPIEPREDTPIKPVFFIDLPLKSVSEKVIEKGGKMFPPKEWELDGRKVCDGYDCEGNIFQLRVPALA